MLIIHHLNNSRSQRVLWLLEELGLPYEIKRYERDKKTNLAPPELKRVHPVGKSPIIEDGDRIFAETGAIIEYVIQVHGRARLIPAKESDDYWRYKYWLHAAEGSYMPPLVLALFLNRMESGSPFLAKPVVSRLTGAVRKAYLDHTTQALFDYLDTELSVRPWLAGEFSAADIMMSFPCEAALTRAPQAKRKKNIEAYVQALHARPAYQRALQKGGPYAYA